MEKWPFMLFLSDSPCQTGSMLRDGGLTAAEKARRERQGSSRTGSPTRTRPGSTGVP